MEEGLIKVTPDDNKAKSILMMVETTLEMVKVIDIEKFSSNVTTEYYDIWRELISILLLLDGYKTYGEGAHKKLIDYLKSNYDKFTEYEVTLIDDLRIIRNKIAYDGFFVEKNYVERKKKDILEIIDKLKDIIQQKMG